MIIFFSSNFNKIESVVIFVVWCFLLSICNFVCVCVCVCVCEWGASFFDVGASLKNCSCHLKEQSCVGPLVSKQTNCLRVGKKSSHKKVLLRAVPIKGIVRFGWQFLRLAPTAWVCYPKGHASTTTTHV